MTALRLESNFQTSGRQLMAAVDITADGRSKHDANDSLRRADSAVQKAQQAMEISNGLQAALVRNELSTRFQAIVNADSSRIVGAELLLRWDPPTGSVSPALFIPIAKATGAIVPIGAWVFLQACLAEVAWRHRRGDSAPYVSISVSTRQLNDAALFDIFAATLRQTGADPARLLLEITETALMADIDASLRALHRLSDLGLRIAIDDFGSGYSSLAQLMRLPVNVLKIDKVLIDGIGNNPESRAVIRAVIGLGRALDLKVVAEGVESAEQRAELCAYGCDLIQGYYFHRPLEEAIFINTFEREIAEGPLRAPA